MTGSLIAHDLREGIAVLTLNNPSRRNALSSRMMEELLRCLADAEQSTDVRVVVIAAEGLVFSSGHDLRELAQGDREEQTLVFALCTSVMESIRLLPKPVIASVQGLATAAGCQLVATCDLAIASENAAFATPGVDIGLFCTTPAVALGRAVSYKVAMEMLLTGEPVSAHDAQKCGLVNRVVPADELYEATLSLARKVASAPASTVSMGKSAFYRQMTLGYASTVRKPLLALCESASQALAETRYTRHSDGEKLYASLVTGLRGLGREVHKSLAASETQLLDRLAPLQEHPAFEEARGKANEAYIRNVLPSVKGAARPVRLTDEQGEAIATDEEATLVLAGTGTGKTSVIVGKLAHPGSQHGCASRRDSRHRLQPQGFRGGEGGGSPMT